MQMKSLAIVRKKNTSLLQLKIIVLTTQFSIHLIICLVLQLLRSPALSSPTLQSTGKRFVRTNQCMIAYANSICTPNLLQNYSQTKDHTRMYTPVPYHQIREQKNPAYRLQNLRTIARKSRF